MNSIIIPTYCPTDEVATLLYHCLGEIKRNTVLEHETIIVENGSQKLSPEAWASYIHTEKPLGFARAVNLGVSLANGDYLFIVNNDIEVPEGWDAKLLGAYNGVLNMALLAPVDNPREVGNVIHRNRSWWSCVLISRKIWQAVGSLDQEQLNFRLHDQDWSMRAKSMGYEVAQFGGVLVKHVNMATYRHMAIDETNERAEMRRRWGYEHFCDWITHRVVS